ncbi:hypothetical protein AVEN_3322-1, partial [Araneus ventricosus]
MVITRDRDPRRREQKVKQMMASLTRVPRSEAVLGFALKHPPLHISLLPIMPCDDKYR